MKCGGASDVQSANAEIQELCNQVRADLEGKVGKSFVEYTAVSYTSQVVAGTNFFVKVSVGGDECAHLRIFRPLPHVNEGPTLHSHQYPKGKDDDIEYF